jgi:homoserine O-succinyltransferase/O-acetyltransferase
MPVLIDINSPDHHLSAEMRSNRKKILRKSRDALGDCVNIGLINNMPDGALVSTERQVFDLLNGAAKEIPIRLHLYALPTISRSEWGGQYIKRFYLNANELFDGELDGLIVTGAEPQAEKLDREPYWGSFGQVIDWAKENTVSAVWSCLALHGAVLHLDGIERRPLGEKCVGVFKQTKKKEHPLLEGAPLHFRIPHSRWNEVSEQSLAASGYNILTCSEEAGVDTFVKQIKKSLFVYFQGHPEYDAHSLLGEYRRDVGRFLRREIEQYPTMPHGYFDSQARELLTVFQDQAHLGRRKELLATFPVDLVGLTLKNSWRATANRIYRNWITYIAGRKPRGLRMSGTATARA